MSQTNIKKSALDNKDSTEENNTFEDLIIANEAAADVNNITTTPKNRYEESLCCKDAESFVSLTSADLPMHDDEALSLQELSTGGYSQSSDVGHSTDATVAHDTSSDSSVQISNDVANWKSLSAREIDTIVLMGPQLLPKSLPKDNKSRSFPMSIFSRKVPNGETEARDWLVWSETAQSLYCFCCCLFATKSPPLSTQSEFSHPQLGCNDNWRKLYEKTLGLIAFNGSSCSTRRKDGGKS